MAKYAMHGMLRVATERIEMTTIRLTAAQALVRYLMAQKNADGEPLVPGIWAIFGHGNVAGLGEALNSVQADFPTWRGHNEQAMAHAAIAFAKAKKRLNDFPFLSDYCFQIKVPHHVSQLDFLPVRNLSQNLNQVRIATTS